MEDRGATAAEQGRYGRFPATLFFGVDFDECVTALAFTVDFFAWLFFSAAFFARETVE